MFRVALHTLPPLSAISAFHSNSPCDISPHPPSDELCPGSHLRVLLLDDLFNEQGEGGTECVVSHTLCV